MWRTAGRSATEKWQKYSVIVLRNCAWESQTLEMSTIYNALFQKKLFQRKVYQVQNFPFIASLFHSTLLKKGDECD